MPPTYCSRPACINSSIIASHTSLNIRPSVIEQGCARQQAQPTCGGGPQEGVSQGDNEGVAEPAQDAHLPQYLLGQVRAAKHVWDALQSHLHALAAVRRLCKAASGWPPALSVQAACGTHTHGLLTISCVMVSCAATTVLKVPVPSSRCTTYLSPTCAKPFLSICHADAGL